SSYVIEYLSEFFLITVFYYNPNIYPEEEYRFRAKQQQEFIKKFPAKNPVDFIEGDYDTEHFYEFARPLAHEPERGERCRQCYYMRLHETALRARDGGFDYFATTLTISPQKDAQTINTEGYRAAEAIRILAGISEFESVMSFGSEDAYGSAKPLKGMDASETIGEIDSFGVQYLPSDFKKKNGYLRSVQISREYEMYRQDYCGCVYSQRDRLASDRHSEERSDEES
ncbi:MAG: epoxyqueuosine reductase QueH, partial [Lachnospiraceae bacterium]|nr:epoxyqueuosine reductase QueH [Lachnospiraceae bacterium]